MSCNRHITQLGPYAVELEAGREYKWCQCGKAAADKQPFCDHAHREDGLFKSLRFTPDKSGPADLCGCKHTANAPYCDGTHTKLQDHK